MEKIKWSEDYEIGIPVIDNQHRRIVVYINLLCDADNSDIKGVNEDVIYNLIDYTNSHFAFEEALMEEAGYDALSIHQQTHRAFSEKIQSLKEKLNDERQTAQQLVALLTDWLLDHIQHDDSSYAALVKGHIDSASPQRHEAWLGKALGNYFKDGY